MKLAKSPPETDKFEDLRIGDNFIYAETLFVKIQSLYDTHGCRYNCIALSKSFDNLPGDADVLVDVSACRRVHGSFVEDV